MSLHNPRSLFVLAGEHSGDDHAAALVTALKEKVSSLDVEAVAGPALRSTDVAPFMAMEELDVMGFTDVFAALPRLYSCFKKVRSHILQTNPTITLLVDYQEFNLRLAKSLRKRGYRGKIVQYISPSVWAWRAGRARVMGDVFDTLLTIFPFEREYFSTTSLSTHYVGNPTKELVDNYLPCDNWKAILNIPNKKFISLFPGSRPSEISQNLPLQLKVAEELSKSEKDKVFALSCTNPKLLGNIHREIEKSTLILGRDLYIIPKEFSYEQMQESCYALAKSGTVTLELALHNIPTVVTYQISKTQEFIAKHLIRLNLPHYCIVNILAKKEVFPEFYGARLSVDKIVEALLLLDEKRGSIEEACSQLHQTFTEKRPADEGAVIIEEMLTK